MDRRGFDMVDNRPDRLEQIAATRGTDPDIRWLIDEVLRLRAEVDSEHAVVLEISERIRTFLSEGGGHP